MDECNDEPQSMHVPPLLAIDGKFPFACDATVDPEAQLPQAVHSEESLRVQVVSKDTAKLHRGQSEAQHADQNRTHLLWECDQASAVNKSCCCREKNTFPTSMQVLICCSSEQKMWDVDAICWWVDQLNFLEFQKTYVLLGRKSHTIMSSHRIFMRL